MLSLQLDRLLLSLKSASAVRLAPPASDRAAWSRVREARRNDAIARAEKARSVSVRLPVLGECLGESDAPARGMIARREAAKALALGVCVGGGYASALADALWAICGEDGWMYPGRNAQCLYRARAVDLFAAETAALLATAAALCGDALDAVSPEVTRRVRGEVRARVLDPVADAANGSWLRGGGTERAVAAVLEMVLTLGEDGDRRWQYLRRALRLLEAHLRSDAPRRMKPLEEALPDSMALADTVGMLKELSGGEVDLSGEAALCRDADMPCATYMGGGWFVNPGYASMRPAVNPEAMYHLGAGVSSVELKQLAAYMARGGAKAADPPFDAPTETLLQQADFILRAEALSRETAKMAVSPAVFREQRGFMAARAGAFACAMHAGSAEHADAGDVVLFYRGEPILIDLGETARADWHNVPSVNGVPQGKGMLAGAADCRFDRDYTVLSLALAPAYDRRAGILSWQRTAMLSPYEDEVRLIDVFDLDGGKGKAAFRFITPKEPLQEAGGARLGDVFLSWDDAALSFSVDRVQPREALFGEYVYRLTLEMREDAPGGNFTFAFRPA